MIVRRRIGVRLSHSRKSPPSWLPQLSTVLLNIGAWWKMDMLLLRMMMMMVLLTPFSTYDTTDRIYHVACQTIRDVPTHKAMPPLMDPIPYVYCFLLFVVYLAS
jgi:hypothetical protein